jgi:hypothetical protein
MRFAWSLVACLALSACALPMADPQSDAAGKQFEPPPAGQAAIYIYRASRTSLDRTSRFRVYVEPRDGERRILGILDDDTWFRVNVSPGSWYAGCTGGDRGHVSNAYAPLAAGQIAYVEISAVPGRWVANCTAISSPEASARPAILKGKRVQEKAPGAP